MHDVSEGSNYILLHEDIQVYQHHLLKSLYCPIDVLGMFGKKRLPIYVKISVYSIGLCLSLLTVPHGFNYYSFIIGFEIWKFMSNYVSVFQLFFFFLAIWNPLRVRVNFKLDFFLFLQKTSLESSVMVQWVRDLVLSLPWLGLLLWHGFDPWLMNFCVPLMWPKKERKDKKKCWNFHRDCIKSVDHFI